MAQDAIVNHRASECRAVRNVSMILTTRFYLCEFFMGTDTHFPSLKFSLQCLLVLLVEVGLTEGKALVKKVKGRKMKFPMSKGKKRE
jgi:hypothetical protein